MKATKKPKPVSPDARLQRYVAAMERLRMPEASRKQAVSNYATALDEESRAVAAVEKLAAERGEAQVSSRRALNALARGIAGCLRREEPEKWVLAISHKVAAREGQGTDLGLLLDGVRVCLAALGRDPALADSVAEAVRMTSEAAGRKAQAKPEPAVNVGVDRRIDPGLLAGIETPSTLEAWQQRDSAELFRAALARMRPWARAVVLGRVGEGMSYRALAEKHGLRVEEVADVLKQAREFVCHSTSCFNDEWYWRDLPATAGESET